MKELTGDILKLIESGEYDAFCITSNGFVKRSGECVMGRGIAQVCRDKYRGIDRILGKYILEKGNHVHQLGHDKRNNTHILSFPVKHKWDEAADIKLIERSCKELMSKVDEYGYTSVLLPRPGCGNGWLKWEDVKPVIAELLDDRIIVCTF